ncbi:MAG: hybrid sensor histidine kinase/response regulator [Desulfamplus sp.]|nr:hybrid sensor histidine kinase/response regulator [Desulfamplus sp.]
MAIDRSKFLARFADEARDHCAKISNGLLLLESAISINPKDLTAHLDTINSLFRSAHTIKGSARMMKLTTIGELAHAMEDLLDAARGSKIELNSQFFEPLFKSVDALLLMVDAIETPDGPPSAPTDICNALREAALAGSTKEPEPYSIEPATIAAPTKPEDCLDQKEQNVNQTVEVKQSQKAQYLHINTAKLDELIRLMGEIISDHNRFKQDVKLLKENAKAATISISNLNSLISKKIAQNGIELYDLTRASENSITAQLALQESSKAVFEATIMHSHLIGELQAATLKLSMMPLSTVFEPLRRTVRDLAKDAKKEVEFIVTGGETEIDRKIAERIGDSLLHMLRNAVDHAIEMPEERLKTGKITKGTISLSAFYNSGGVTISLKDDGAGLNVDKIKAKALAKHLFDGDTLNMMSRTEILNLIFLPGFSTSPIITDLSGRGVGMDVVRKNVVDDLKGTIVMDSFEGVGTSFMLHLPLNLAVFVLCMVLAGGKHFALPATSICELCSIKLDEIIEIVGKKAIRLREEIIAIEYLAEVLQIRPSETLNRLPIKPKQILEPIASVVIVKDGANKLGLIVDEIIGREEMVVKPLPALLSNLKIITGATIGAGDSVINVLNTAEIIKAAARQSGHNVSYSRDLADKFDNLGLLSEVKTILVVDDSANTREIEKSILEAYGYTVETADDGEDALEKSKNRLYDLVITDVEMPRLDGFSLTEQLRADERYRSVPIVIVTSLEKEADKKRGIMAGADAYIVKRAFDQSNLLDTVKNLIG